MDKDKLLHGFPEYRGQVSHTEKISSCEAEYVNPSSHLPKKIVDGLPFDNLYSHQARSLWEIKAGSNLCVTTETSSGKTLIFSLAIAKEKIKHGDVSALLVYPTKALSRDQKKEIEKLYEEIGVDIEIGVYDGDTSRDEKRRIRNESDVVITNLQGLNYYLPYHRKWSNLFSGMDYIVIDEGHTYTGVSGMHASWIIRRLLRILERVYDTEPQMIISSATIGNAKEQAKKLTGKDFVVVDEAGNPKGERDIVLWNPPPFTDEDGVHRRRSSHKESAKVVAHLSNKGFQTLCFCRSRKLTELIRKWTKEFSEDNYDDDIVIESYNAGYTKKERREIENSFKNEEIDALISTNALEVGIDIGSIDCTVLDSYPGSRISFYQQIGRSGRAGKESLSVTVLKNSSIDQYINDTPSYLLSKGLEDCVIDLTNKSVLVKHVLAASNETPVDKRDLKYFGEELKDAASVLNSMGKLEGKSLSKGYHYAGDGRPSSDISIYSASDEKYEIRILKNGKIVKNLPEEGKARVYRDFHPGAIHLHRGNKYIVDNISHEDNYVNLKPTNSNYTTVSNSEVRISDVKLEDSYNLNSKIEICRGRATVRENFDTYQKIYEETGEKESGISTGIDEDLEIRTHVTWIKYPTKKSTMGSLHAAEHSMIKISPTILKIDSDDIGGLSVSSHPASDGESAIFIYDGIEGGVGFSHSIYRNMEEIINRASSRLGNCECSSEKGCPACTMSSSCGDGNEPLDREGAIEVFKNLSDKFK